MRPNHVRPKNLDVTLHSKLRWSGRSVLDVLMRSRSSCCIPLRTMESIGSGRGERRDGIPSEPRRVHRDFAFRGPQSAQKRWREDGRMAADKKIVNGYIDASGMKCTVQSEFAQQGPGGCLGLHLGISYFRPTRSQR